LIEVLRFAIRFYLRRADRVVAIGETMRHRLEDKGADPDRVVVIPNWVDTSELSPRPRDNAWAREHGLVKRFVVMHSGNIGHAQNLDSLIRAGTFLRDLDDLRIILIGGGARRDELKELTKLLEVDAVYFLGYQPREMLSDSLSSADVHVVGLARGLAGYIVPSRLYGILAAGRPVIVTADEESETARVVREVGCGVVVLPGRPELLAEQIRRAHGGELDLAAMGARGREYVTSESDRRVAVERYRRVLSDVVSDGTGRR
jgi:glycosyltransferase involved in cell wall biosynthesis